ncbi:MAG: hypothetical protein H5U37_07615 [Caldisericia bacterium]|nr:hypothetical protein [Caldisericia bacterium]
MKFKKVRFSCFEVIVESGKEGGTKPFSIIYANDLLTNLFLNRKINFVQIGKILLKVYNKFEKKEFSVSILEDLKKEIKQFIEKEVKNCI